MAPESLPERGPLQETPLPRVLLELHRARYTGALALMRGRVGKRILLREGAPVAADSNLASESLGVQLMDAGRLSRDDHLRVCDEVKRRRCKEGAALLALRLLEPKELFLALKEQLRRRVIECFGWPDGEFQLDPSETPPEDAHPFRTDLVALVQEGIARHWSADRILVDLMPHAERYPLSAPGEALAKVARRLESDPQLQDLIVALDGRRTLGQLLAGARSSARALAAAWVMDALGALLYRETPATPGEEAEPPPAPDIEILVDETGSGARRGAGGRAASGPARPRAAAAGPSPEAEKLRSEIQEKHERLDDLDYYAMLSLEHDANPVTIKKAYFQAAKRYHPDALARLGLGELRGEATEVFGRIAEAYEVLSDPTRRRDYDASLADDGPEIDVQRLAQAEGFFRKGEVLLRMGNFTGALEFLEPAARIWPEEPAYQAALGWAYLKARPPRPEAAREHLARAVEGAPKDAPSLYRLGLATRQVGDAAEGDRLIARARALDPKVG
jgi:DnaJ domain/Domain of unknown function (DUF4388)